MKMKYLRLFFKMIIYSTIISIFLIPAKGFSNTITLEQLQTLIESSPDIKIAQQQYNIAKAKVNLSQSLLCPTLFGSTTYTNYSNPVESSSYNVTDVNKNGNVSNYIETLTPIQKRYNNISMNVGISIPLFGSYQSLRRDLILSNSELNQSEADIELKKWQSIKALRYAYAQYFIRSIQILLANDYLKDKEQVERILQNRLKAGLIIKPDKTELDTQFYLVERNKTVYEKELVESLDLMEMLTGHNLSNFEAVYPDLNTNCVSRDVLLNSMYKNPQIKLYKEKYKGYSKIFSEGNSIFSSGQLNLSTGIQNNFQNSIGWNVSATLSVSMPLFEKKWRNADLDKVYYEKLKAENELQYQEVLYQNAVNSYYFWLKSRQENLDLQEKRLEAAIQAYEFAKLRDVVDPGDTIYNLIKSKYNLYLIANDYLEAHLALIKAQADILGLDNNLHCSSTTNNKDMSMLNEVVQILEDSLAANKNSFNLSFYDWDGLKLYKTLGRKNFWQSLGPTKRVFLSFDSKQIDNLITNKSYAKLLRGFIREASERGVYVELLLGDPQWALDNYRDNLVKIIREFSQFGFSGIQLDIEKSQLPPEQQSLWDTGIIKTIQEIRKHSNLPIGLSMNYKEALNSRLLDELYKSGLNEVVIMLYTTNINRVKQVVTPIVMSHPELLFSIAQSIEPTTILKENETYASKGKPNALKSWATLNKYFSQFPNFKGIVVQSLEDYLGCKR